MSIGAILVGLALLILSIPIVAGPVVNKRRKRFSLTDRPETVPAPQQYQDTLAALRDLDFDHQLGVVSEDDYPVLRARLLTEAAAVRDTAGTALSDDVDERIEAAIRARRGKKATPVNGDDDPGAEIGRSCYHCGTEMDADDKFCAACGSAAAPVCSHCGRQAEPGDKFCAGCGAHLPVGVAA